MKEFQNHSLLQHTTFGIDAKASRYIEYYTEDELQGLLLDLRNTPFLHIGGGSNLLFTQDYEGTILHSGIKGISVEENGDEVLLRAASGEVWDDVVAYAVSNGWSGMENLSLIPGEVGASAVQNIGAYGVEAKDLITKVETLEVATGNKRVFTNEECQYAYRHSIFKQELKGQYIVLAVTYRLSKTFTPKLDYGNIRSELERQNIDLNTLTPAHIRQVIIDIRNAKLPDPKNLGNAGSFFMNPVISKELHMLLQNDLALEIPFYEVDEYRVKVPAGWLIEHCGWKGCKMGNVGVYEKQALILVNHGGASGNEVVQISDAICKDVKEKFGISIHPEVNFI